ncbi:hypothetical protein NUU61_005900 [Penicillium alfredii]|uniref:Uncharacterized protein n=1 Tax=Penicillium alfredii TaxID=1506179 RepID=A0A9W9FAQ4_9EURO|nr:uncharacterized protein NUU61_005900 [Penicillium alfredii]KAJ5096544.1 hypothetical protein NUU61_005900 [Penicillium alfredii]
MERLTDPGTPGVSGQGRRAGKPPPPVGRCVKPRWAVDPDSEVRPRRHDTTRVKKKTRLAGKKREASRPRLYTDSPTPFGRMASGQSFRCPKSAGGERFHYGGGPHVYPGAPRGAPRGASAPGMPTPGATPEASTSRRGHPRSTPRKAPRSGPDQPRHLEIYISWVRWCGPPWRPPSCLVHPNPPRGFGSRPLAPTPICSRGARPRNPAAPRAFPPPGATPGSSPAMPSRTGEPSWSPPPNLPQPTGQGPGPRADALRPGSGLPHSIPVAGRPRRPSPPARQLATPRRRPGPRRTTPRGGPRCPAHRGEGLPGRGCGGAVAGPPCQARADTPTPSPSRIPTPGATHHARPGERPPPGARTARSGSPLHRLADPIWADGERTIVPVPKKCWWGTVSLWGWSVHDFFPPYKVGLSLSLSLTSSRHAGDLVVFFRHARHVPAHPLALTPTAPRGARRRPASSLRRLPAVNWRVRFGKGRRQTPGGPPPPLQAPGAAGDP